MKTINLFIMICMLNSMLAQNNYAKIEVNQVDDYSDFNQVFSDSILNNYKVYFTGENHNFQHINSQLEFKLLTYLNKKQSVNHFLFEQSPAIGYIMTKITIDNDSRYKTFLKDNYAKPFYDLILNIKKYNTKQVARNKIKVNGIDVERYPAFSIFALGKITDSLDITGETGLIYEAIESLNSSEFANGTASDIYNSGGTRENLSGDIIDAWSTFETIIVESKKHSDLLKNELGDAYHIYTQILESVSQGHAWFLAEKSGDLSAPSMRERFMLKQFNLLNDSYPSAKYYGQFGRCHLHSDKKAKKCYSHNMKSIANRINTSTDTTLTGKVLSIPIYYSTGSGNGMRAIKSMNLDDRFDLEGQNLYLVDLEYLNDDVPFKGFEVDMPFVIVNSYDINKQQKEDYFKETIIEYHLGVYTGYNYHSGISKLNFELNKVGAINFTDKFKTYSFAYDVFTLNQGGGVIAYNYIPKISNGDRFTLKGSSFTLGAYYPAGNKYFVIAPGINLTYGSMTLVEDSDNTVPNLIQDNQKNITVYTNDVFTIDPNIDFRITLPIISINARFGYALDVSGKHWKLDGKMKDFTKTSFTAPYFQIGLSLNYKDIK